jgi:hypothetical protein
VRHIDDAEEAFEPFAPVPDDDPPEESDDPPDAPDALVDEPPAGADDDPSDAPDAPDPLGDEPSAGRDESLVEVEDDAALEDESSDELHAVAQAPSATAASTAAVQRTALFSLAVMISLPQHRVPAPVPTMSSASYGR